MFNNVTTDCGNITILHLLNLNIMIVTVVHGAPLSGKTTYVQERLGTNDIVFDYDKLMAAVTFRADHDHNRNLVNYILDFRRLIISRLKSEKKVDQAWIITTNISKELEEQLMGLNPKYIEIKSDIYTTKKRLKENPGGRDVERWSRLIDDYYNSKILDESFYNTPEWKRKRKVILARDNYLCKECSRYGKTTTADTIHHILPLDERYDLRLSNTNLVSLCDACHEDMHDRYKGGLSKLGKEWRERLLRREPGL